MTQALAKLGYNDAVLFLSLLYSSVDIACEWEMFDTCRRPLHHWLLVSYAAVVTFRTTHILGTKTSGEGNGDFLLNLRQKGAISKALVSFTWLIALPFFSVWTVVGSYWLWDTMQNTPQCLPLESHLWFIMFWQALSYVWIIIHVALGGVAWLLERRVRSAEADLQSVEDADSVARWGQVSQMQSYMSLQSANAQGAGLTPKEIALLPPPFSFEACEGDSEGDCGSSECPICLNDFNAGDGIRRLPGCSHTFHRSCIDLWLLRRADCPLCKGKVTVEGCTKCSTKATAAGTTVFPTATATSSPSWRRWAATESTVVHV